MLDLVLSLMMLGAVALAAGSFMLFRRGERQKALLMAVLVVVILVNLAIWLLPMAGGGPAPVEQAAAAR